MNLLHLEHPTSGPTGFTWDDEHKSLCWDHRSARVALSCVPFHLEHLHPRQVFWSYVVDIESQSTVGLDNIVLEVVATAQSLSDQRALPSTWSFSARDIFVRNSYVRDLTISSESHGSGSAAPQSLESAQDDPLSIYQPHAQTPKTNVRVSNLIFELVPLVLEGGKAFARNKQTQLSWNGDVEELRPEKMPSSQADLITAFNQYSQATGRRAWQAKFLLGCSLLSTRYTPEGIICGNKRGLKSLARCIISLLNSLFRHIGEEAFKVIPAMSENHIRFPPCSRFGQLPKEDCQLLGENLASALLKQSYRVWTHIDIRYTFDPAELLQLADRTLDQTRATIGLSAKFDRSFAYQEVTTHENSRVISSSQELPLPAILPYDSAIFVCVQQGDVDAVRGLFCNAAAHVNTVDPYGLSLAYYAAYYCCRACDLRTSCSIYVALVNMGVNPEWRDEISNTARETMLDSAMAHLAMRKATHSTFSNVVESIACMNTGHSTECDRSELLLWYLRTRAFSPVHHALLNLGESHESLQSRLDAAIATGGCQIDEIDRSGRTALAWAVEYRYVEGVQTLLRCGASANLIRSSVCGDVRISLLHLLLAGPTDDDIALTQIVEALIRAGADVTSTDNEGWTPVHIAASWNMCTILQVLLGSGDQGQLIAARTLNGETAYDLTCSAGCDETMQLLLEQGTTLYTT